jgi:hypothetical protein
VVVGPFVLYGLIDSVSATASSRVPVTVLKIGGGRRCLYLRVCRILIKKGGPPFLIFVAGPYNRTVVRKWRPSRADRRGAH